MKLTLLFILELTIFSLSAQSLFQKGWIVTSKGDTLSGFIADDKLDNLSKGISFKTYLNDKPQLLKPTELTAFYIAPNQYFESHLAHIKSSSYKKGKDDTIKQRFLYRSEAGYISVFTLLPENILFIKKHGDSIVQPLFMTVIRKQQDGIWEKTDTFTLCDEDLSRYGAAKFHLRYDYIYTLNKLFNEGQPYEPKVFALKEERVIYEVRKYNKSVHPNFVAYPIVSKEKWHNQLSVGLCNSFAWLPKNYIEGISNRTPPETPYFGGLGLVAAWSGRNKLKDASVEIGYTRFNSINIDYKYDDIFGKTLEGQFKGQTNCLIFKVNYIVNTTHRFSPYLGLTFWQLFYKKSLIEKEQNTTVIKTILDNHHSRGLIFFQSLGVQYAISKQHMIYTGFNFSILDFKLRYSTMSIGYFYRFKN